MKGQTERRGATEIRGQVQRHQRALLQGLDRSRVLAQLDLPLERGWRLRCLYNPSNTPYIVDISSPRGEFADVRVKGLVNSTPQGPQTGPPVLFELMISSLAISSVQRTLPLQRVDFIKISPLKCQPNSTTSLMGS